MKEIVQSVGYKFETIFCDLGMVFNVGYSTDLAAFILFVVVSGVE